MHKSRINKVLDNLNKHNCSAMLVTNVANVTYLTGFTGDSSHLLITDTKNYLLTDGRYTEQAEIECAKEIEVLLWIDNKRYDVSTYQHLCDQLNISEMAVEASSITYADYNKLSTGLKDCTILPVDGIVEDIRQTKDETEITLLKKACRLSDEALKLLVPEVKPGVTEIQLTAQLEYNLKTIGADDISFTTIVLSGAKTSLLHGKPDDKKIEYGDFLLFDFGALYKGYHADISRTFIIGQASNEQQKMYNAIYESQKRAVECLAAGVEGKLPDTIVRKTIPENYLQYYYPGLGHGVGLDIHELPFIKNTCEFTYKPGMVVTIEPGIYIPGKGGLRIEDTVLITEDGNEILTGFSKEYEDMIIR